MHITDKMPQGDLGLGAGAAALSQVLSLGGGRRAGLPHVCPQQPLLNHLMTPAQVRGAPRFLGPRLLPGPGRPDLYFPDKVHTGWVVIAFTDVLPWSQQHQGGLTAGIGPGVPGRWPGGSPGSPALSTLLCVKWVGADLRRTALYPTLPPPGNKEMQGRHFLGGIHYILAPSRVPVSSL